MTIDWHVLKRNGVYVAINLSTNCIVLIDVENVGLSLSYGLSLNSVLFWAIYMSCFIENKMVSVERIKQFSKIQAEAAWNIKDRSPPPNWPGQGHVDIKDLQVKEEAICIKPNRYSQKLLLYLSAYLTVDN